MMQYPDKKEIKIALAMIVKNSPEEAKLLDRCLENVSPFVDGIFVTVTMRMPADENHCLEVLNKHKANSTFFHWANDFSKARNHSFAQVPKDYDYILWCDADDLFRGLEKLKPTIEENPTIDAFALWYMYEFDNERQPTVVHKKTQVIKNDGCAVWKGALHEDLIPERSIDIKLIEGIERMHFPNENHALEVGMRNVEISKAELNDDPRTLFNLGNSYIGNNQYKEAKEMLEQFIEKTGSSEEKYIALMRLANIEGKLENTISAVNNLQLAIGLKPDYPDAYHQLSYLYFDMGKLDDAEHYSLQGLIKKPKQHDIIVYNPRDYDYHPMSLLAKVYFKKDRPDLALPLLEGCLKIYPNNKNLKQLIGLMKKETVRLGKVLKVVARLEKQTDPEKIKKELAKIPKDLQSHPAICMIRNKHFIKTESTGKDIVYYCGMTVHEWNPEMAKTKGIGGSEEAVINLSKEWVKQGYNVTVYNSCGMEEMICDGVTYKPFWTFNIKDKNDILILWRHPKLLDYDLNFSKVYVDLHDVIPEKEFNAKRLEKINKILVKTEFHRSLFPSVPTDKFAVIPNGIDFELFDQDIQKDPYLMVNTSSPDRSLDVLPELFKRVKEYIPEVKLKWAYGWEIFDNTFSDNAEMMKWRKKITTDMEEAGIENLGRLSQKDCAKLYLEGNILAYPTEFAEIDCITVKKAQACGCIPITTDFGALNESVQFGFKVHSPKTKDNWAREGKFAYGIEDEEVKNEWVKTVVHQLRQSIGNRDNMKEWSKQFKWELIASRWSVLWI